MRLSRRELLAAAATTVAAGCSIKPGSRLRLTGRPGRAGAEEAAGARPGAAALAPGSCGRAIDDRPSLPRPTRASLGRPGRPTQEELLLALSAGGPGGIDIALVDGVSLGYLIAERRSSRSITRLCPTFAWCPRLFPIRPTTREAPTRRQGLHHRRLCDRVCDAAPTARGPRSLGLRARYPQAGVGARRPRNVIGAAMLALGHGWSSADVDDLEDVGLPARPARSLVVEGALDRDGLGAVAA